MQTSAQRDSAQCKLLALTAVLFVAYLCVAIPLATVPVYVTHRLHLGAGWAGLAVGIAFLSTILTRGHAGAISDRHGAKIAVVRGLTLYVSGALCSLISGLSALDPVSAYGVLILGRLLLGLGESLVGVGIIAWGIGTVGPQHSGRVIAIIGIAIYAALALGGPLGLVLESYVGFASTMGVAALLPCFGLIAIWPMAGVTPQGGGLRPAFTTVIGRIWAHGCVVCAQGIGFAAIGSFFALRFLQHGWQHAGFGLTAFGAGFVLVLILCGNLPDRIGGIPVAMGSLAIEGVGQFLIWSAPEASVALMGAFLTGLGCSMIFPAMGREVVKLVEPQLRGVAIGGFSAFQDLAYGLTGPLAGLLAARAGYDAPFLIGGVAALAGLCIVLRLGYRSRVATCD